MDRCTYAETPELVVYACGSSEAVKSDWGLIGNGCKNASNGARYCACSTDNCEPTEAMSSNGNSSF